MLESLLSKTSLKYKLVRSNKSFLHLGVSADVIDEDGAVIASFGKIHPIVAKNYDIPNNVFYCEVNTQYLADLPEKVYNVKTISKFPTVERDLAVVVDEKVTVGEILSSIKSACGNLYYDSYLFDIYRNNSLGDNKKSLAFKIKLSDMNKTLTDDEVQTVVNKILKALSYKHGAVLR